MTQYPRALSWECLGVLGSLRLHKGKEGNRSPPNLSGTVERVQDYDALPLPTNETPPYIFTPTLASGGR